MKIDGRAIANEILNELKERVQKLKEKGLPNGKAILEKPLKTLGEHEVQVDLGEGIKVNVKISLIPLK